MSMYCVGFLGCFFCWFFCKSPGPTRPEGHFKVIFFLRPLPPTPRAETGLPLLQFLRIYVGLGIISLKPGRYNRKHYLPNLHCKKGKLELQICHEIQFFVSNRADIDVTQAETLMNATSMADVRRSVKY